MANKKIRVTFLWADEAAVVQDFNAGYSQKLVEWANAFYGKHGFELEVAPAPGGTAKEAYTYCLAKTGGYEPDIASAEEFAERLLKLKRPTFVAWLQAYRDMEALEGKEKAKKEEINLAIQHLATLPVAEMPARLDALRILNDELTAITDAVAAQRKLYDDLGKKLDAIDAQYAKQRALRDFDTPMRLALGLKVLSSFSLRQITGISTGGENPAVVDGTRLKVLFCRFRLSPNLQVLRPGPQPYGFATDPIDFNQVDGKYLWDGPFIAVNLNKQELITLAHEITHAAGRGHRADFERMKDLGKFVRSITMDPINGKLNYPDLYERVEGPYFDGPDDDIINYKTKGKKPDQVKLYPEDVKRMEDAFFVKDPP
jgi:hypothetical protein